MNTTTRLACMALLATGASTVAAQSSVQLYGRINTAIEWQKYDGKSVTGMTSNGSFIGFRGQEDLGYGNKAGVVLEADFDTDTGKGQSSTGIDFMRHSEVYLSSNWGMVRLGSFDNASYAMVAKPLNLLNDNAGSISDYSFRTNKRINTLAYRTPELGGWIAELQHQFGEKQAFDGDRDDGGWDLGASHAQGPWAMALGYSQNKSSSTAVLYQNKEQNLSLQTHYSTGNWMLGAYYQWSKFTEKTGADAAMVDKRGLARLAAMYRWNASEVHANVSRVYTLKSAYPQTTGRSGINHWTLGYHYNLSKRSRIYALWGRLDGISKYSYPSLLRSTRDFSQTHTSVLLGMRHVF